MSDIEPGVYVHYKGSRYLVLGVGEHSETGEKFVIYSPLYESETQYWVRPAAMFAEIVIVGGIRQPRFKKEIND